MDTATHKNLGLSHISLPDSLVLGESVPIPRQEKHYPLKEGIVNTYRFKYCDLDAYRHVNTVRYVALLLNQFTLDELDEVPVSRMELSFLHEATYGMETEMLRFDASDNSLVSSFQLTDSKTGTILLFARVMRDNGLIVNS